MLGTLHIDWTHSDDRSVGHLCYTCYRYGTICSKEVINYHNFCHFDNAFSISFSSFNWRELKDRLG
jgi:hypothetical protein